jgi:pimeloyl-ACP methyl ester carboxylesterase
VFAIIRRQVKIIKRLLAGLLLLLALFVFGFVPYWLAGIATTRRFQFPDKENAGLTPASFQLAFEDVSFRSRDGIELKGWWVPARAARGSVVLVHGLNRSRIEMVRKVPFLHEQGWNALLFDLRHHGESGGERSTLGWLEKNDVAAAVALARARTQGPVVLWGVSMGAASATLAAAEDPSVAGLVCDSSYRSLRDTVWHHAELARRWVWWARVIPAWAVAPQAIFFMGRRGGFDPDAVDVVAAAAHLAPRPSLFVCNSGDRRMPPAVAADLKAAAGPTAQLLVVEGKSHGGAFRDGGEAYQQAVKSVLARVLERSGPATAGETGRGGAEGSTWAAKAREPS